MQVSCHLAAPKQGDKLVCLSDRRGSASWQLLPGLGTQPADHILTSKRTYDAFHATELQALLEANGVDSVIVCGVMTNLCCETTAR